jgi:hypothetical protein
MVGYADALANPKARHTFTDSGDAAHDLVTQLHGLRRIRIIDLHQVGAADAAQCHAHENFTGAGNRLRHINGFNRASARTGEKSHGRYSP